MPAADRPKLERVDEALAAAKAAGLDRLDAQLLLAHRLARPRTWLIAHPEARIAAEVAEAFLGDLRQRADDVPLAYLLGEREFGALTLTVSPAVLVPRPDTETLVDWALELLSPGGPLGERAAPVVVDLGTGSGAIGLSIRRAHPHARVTAVDASEAALAIARANAARLGLPIECRLGDWLDGFDAASIDLIVSNPPYVAAGDPHLPALRHEPREALVAGADGLDDLRRIAASAPACLRPDGWLLLEHGADQADEVGALLRRAGLVDVAHRQDLAGRDRCTGGRRVDPR